MIPKTPLGCVPGGVFAFRAEPVPTSKTVRSKTPMRANADAHLDLFQAAPRGWRYDPR
jgi:hypothetical protein